MGEIALYGNLINDNIHIVKNGNLPEMCIKRTGGVNNVLRAITKNSHSIFTYGHNAQAHIYVEEEKENVSYVQWDKCSHAITPSKEKYDWTHIAYLDRIDNAEELIDTIRPNVKTISVDVAIDMANPEFGKVFNSISEKIDLYFAIENK